MVQLPVNLGGLHKGAIYICTEDLFPSKRLYQLATCFSDYNTIMNNVFLEHISDYVSDFYILLTVTFVLLGSIAQVLSNSNTHVIVKA